MVNNFTESVGILTSAIYKSKVEHKGCWRTITRAKAPTLFRSVSERREPCRDVHRLSACTCYTSRKLKATQKRNTKLTELKPNDLDAG